MSTFNCRTSGIAFSFAMFGQGTGPILLDNVGCTGSENRLIECSHNGVGQHDCAHFEDASVQCDGKKFNHFEKGLSEKVILNR